MPSKRRRTRRKQINKRQNNVHGQINRREQCEASAGCMCQEVCACGAVSNGAVDAAARNQQSSGQDEQPHGPVSTMSSIPSLATATSLIIGKVKNLWLSATSPPPPQEEFPPSCPLHAHNTLQFLCIPCQLQLCVLCKLSDHEGHETKTLQLAVAEAKQRIDQAKHGRLKDFEERLKGALRETENGKDNIKRMMVEVEGNIRQSHAQLQRLIDEQRDSSLLELEALGVGVEERLDADRDRLAAEVQELAHLRQQMDSTVAGTDAAACLALDETLNLHWNFDSINDRKCRALPEKSFELESITSRSSADELKQLRTIINNRISRPVLKEKMLPKPSLGVQVTPMFKCCEDPDVHVMSVCPTVTGEGGKLAVSYSMSQDFKVGVTKSFFRDGRPSKSFPQFGLCTLVRGNYPDLFFPLKVHRKKVSVPFILPATDIRAIFSKSGSLYTLLNYGGNWNVFLFYLLSYPFNIIWKRCVYVKYIALLDEVVSPLAFDMVQNGSMAALVDVKRSSCSPLDIPLMETERKVIVYMFLELPFSSVYEPPSQPFLPSDVCFYEMEGETVLLVADLATDSIHVVRPPRIDQNVFRRCEFQRYLVSDCDTMKQPTALNTDETGRLWVACKGGQILSITSANQD